MSITLLDYAGREITIERKVNDRPTARTRAFKVLEQGPLCDDCVSILADIHPRQQTYQILRDARGVVRMKGTCHGCGREKTTTVVG